MEEREIIAVPIINEQNGLMDAKRLGWSREICLKNI